MAGVETAVRNAAWHGKRVDLLISRGKVLDILPPADEDYEDAENVDASAYLLLPSMVDCHAHFRDPGYTYKEDIASGLTAAAYGGFGAVMCMANTDPVNDNAAVTGAMLAKADQSWPGGPFLKPVGALSKGLLGKELAPMAELAKAGCVAVSNDGLPISDTEFFRRCMEYASNFGLKVIDHCEDPTMNPGAGVNEGAVSSRLGLRAQPTVAESIQAARDIQLAAYLDLPVHLAHISCRESVELIAEAKARGVPVTAETCPHYLIFTEEVLEGYDTSAKVNPPLRTKDDQTALCEAVRSGVIDIVATDHAPHAAHEKEVPFQEAPCGISGLDTALPAMFRLINEGVLTTEDLVRLMCTTPSDVFDLGFGRIRQGGSADFLLYDPEERWEVSAEAMRSKSSNTPLFGRMVQGRVKMHWLRGKRIV